MAAVCISVHASNLKAAASIEDRSSAAYSTLCGWSSQELQPAPNNAVVQYAALHIH